MDPNEQAVERLREVLHNAVALWGSRCTDEAQQIWLSQTREALAALTPAAVSPGDAGNGWVYFNEDTGEEYASNHPVDSGEVPDATSVRKSTAMEDHLHQLWQSTLPAAVSPSAQGGVGEVLVRALERISKLTPKAANAFGANDMHFSVQAIAESALASYRTTESGWLDISTYELGTYVLFWLPVGEQGKPTMEAAMAYEEADGLLHPWTNGGPNAGSDYEFTSQPTHWRYPPAPPQANAAPAGEVGK